MMQPLTNENITAILPLLDTPIFRLVGNSIIAGLTPARVWVDDPGSPKTVLANEGRNIHLSGAADNDETNTHLAEVFRTEIAPECEWRGIAFFKLHYSPANWRTTIEALFGPLQLDLERRIYCSLSDRSSRHGPDIPNGFMLRLIDDKLFDSEVDHLDLLTDEIRGGWASIHTFLDRGFGFVMLNGSSIVCWCTSEYVSEKHCGMGIETVGAYQGRGIATIVGGQVAEQAQVSGLSPYWDCWESNKPSSAVAEKIGFADPFYYKIAVGTFE